MPDSRHHDHHHEHLHGIAHRHSDVYTTENPIPSIQRFLSKGLGNIVAGHGKAEDENEYESSDSSSESSEQESKRKSGGSRRETAKQWAGLGRRRSRNQQRPTDHQNSQAPHPIDRPDDEKTPEERSKEGSKKPAREQKGKRGEATKVIDPVTQQEVLVRDVRRKDYRRAMAGEDARVEGQQKDHSIQAPVNTVNSVFPPEVPIARLGDVHPRLVPIWILWSLALLAVCRSWAAVVFAMANAWIGWWAFRHVKLTIEDRRWERERERGETARKGSLGKYDDEKGGLAQIAAAGGQKEGAEWFNSVLQGLWEVIDPALFESAAGTLEDVMQASAPAFIHMIKVSAVAHGTTPIRVAGVRILPDQEAEHVVPDTDKTKDKGSSGEQGDDSRTLSGTHINLELSLVYHAAKSGASLSSRSKNARLEMQFFLGLRKVVTFPLPIWVEIKGFVGTVRLRLQLTPDAPFIKNLTFTFLGLPRVQVEVVPLHINLSSIPFLAGFVQNSIDAAMAEYCAPSSLTLDVGEILMGDNIKRDVTALGVIVVWIHSAYDLEKSDRSGSSDPYVTIAHSHGKVSYATRVALNDLNPRWEERHVMLLNPESVRAKEKLSLALWDSDRFTADDVLGRVEFDLEPLIRRPGHIFERSDSLMGLSNEMKKEGQLKWSVAFFKKEPNHKMDKSADTGHEGQSSQQSETEKPDEKTPDPTPSQDDQDDRSRGSDNSKVATAKLDDDPLASLNEGTSTQELLQMLDAAEVARQTRNQKNDLIQRPPSQDVPSGILSIQVHNISDLRYRSEGTKQSIAEAARASGKVGSSAQQVNDKDDESENPDSPSPYINIVLNDQTVMQSRVKALTSAPFFQIGVERFVRDWRRSYVMVVVRDRRLREADPILGVVPIDLRQLLEEHGTSQLTQYFPIAGGLAYGRARISVLFRPVSGMHIDKSKLGFDVGTMRVHSSLRATDLSDYHLLRFCSIRMRTLVGEVKVSSRSAHRIKKGGDKDYTRSSEEEENDDGDSPGTSPTSSGIEWHISKSRLFLRVPVRRRYAAPFVFEFRRPNALGVKSLVAAALIWMQDVEDDVPFDAALPIYKGKPDLHRLLQNYHCARTEADKIGERLGVERIGTLHVQLQFKSGIGKIHAKLDHNPDSRAVMEAWQACVSAGLRSATGDFAEDKAGGDKERSRGEERESDHQMNGAYEDGDEGQENSDGVSEKSEADDNDEDDDDDEDRQDSEEDEGEQEKNSTGDNESKWQQWRRESRELHRQHRGLKSHKPVRSAEWVWKTAKERGAKVKRKLTVQERQAQQIDSEL